MIRDSCHRRRDGDDDLNQKSATYTYFLVQIFRVERRREVRKADLWEGAGQMDDAEGR